MSYSTIKRRTRPRRKRPDLPEFKFIKRKSVKVFPNGREVCRIASAKGRNEYRRRIEAMWERQKHLCCDCRQPLELKEATFEHENGRGAAKQDDRIEIYGRPINGAAHMFCNFMRGSKRTPIWHGVEQFYEVKG